MLIIDLDHFKQVNDQCGHQAGDAALMEVAARIRHNLRPTDLVARYGGEEFVALLPRTPFDTLKQVTRRLNAAVREHPIPYNGMNISVTISIGASMLTAERPSLNELMSQADQSVYKAKAAGRNCTVIFTKDFWDAGAESPK